MSVCRRPGVGDCRYTVTTIPMNAGNEPVAMWLRPRCGGYDCSVVAVAARLRQWSWRIEGEDATAGSVRGLGRCCAVAVAEGVSAPTASERSERAGVFGERFCKGLSEPKASEPPQ